MSISILVTGASGTTGKEVMNNLIHNNNVNLRCAYRDLKKAIKHSSTNAQNVYLDYEKDDSIKNALEGVDSVYLLPPVASSTQQRVDYCCNFIDIANSLGISHIVDLSSMNAHLEETSPHKAIEDYIKSQGIDFTHLRANYFMQNFTTYYVDAIKQQHAIDLYIGNATISFIDARDIGAVAAQTLLDQSHRNQAYTLTGPDSLTHKQVADTLSFFTGLNIRSQPVSDDDTRAYLTQAGFDEAIVKRLLVIFEQTRLGNFEEITNDVYDIIGSSPRTFKEFAQDYRQHFL